MKKLSAIVLTLLFASMQISYATETSLGNINSATGGFAGVDGALTNDVTLKFDGNSHVNWDTLNVNGDQSLNFNAVNGASGLTVLNTVNRGMSTIAGRVSANPGIAQLIISNPNGVLFDGAHFTTAGDLMLTTQDLSNLNIDDISKTDFTKLDTNGKNIIIKGSTFEVNGDYTVLATKIGAENSTINAKNVKLITLNGQDYLKYGKDEVSTKLKAVNVNGNLYITNDVGAVKITDGGTINGNTKIVTNGNVELNKDDNGSKLVMNGDVDVKGNGAQMFLRNAEVNGNLKMINGGGFLDVGNVHVTKDATLKTQLLSTNNMNCKPVKHFVHVIGDTKVDGNLNIESENNIHIGGYDYSKQELADGSLTVGGDLSAHAKNGHVTTTIDTKANKISLKSDNYNILTDGKAVLTANEYEFSANGYIGGLPANETHTAGGRIVSIMENYIHIPDTVGTTGYVNIAGGTISKIETPQNASTYIKSIGDVRLTGANAGTINITAPNKYMEITGDVHAKEINVGKETDKLKVDYPQRDYVLNYTNIRDGKQVTIQKNEEITYNLTNAKNGYNDGTQVKGETTYLVGPDAPVDPDIPTPPTPDNPDPINPDDNENVKVLHSFENHGVDLNQVQTPIAYAADLDDDNIDTGVRENVDGSVTVVRAFPMVN